VAGMAGELPARPPRLDPVVRDGNRRWHCRRHATSRGGYESAPLEITSRPVAGCVACEEATRRNAATKPPAHLIVDGNRVTCSEHSISGGGIKTPPYRIDVPSVGCKTCEDAAELNMNAYQLSIIIGNAQGAAAAGVSRPIVGHEAETE
jgi:hypothetical protein